MSPKKPKASLEEIQARFQDKHKPRRKVRKIRGTSEQAQQDNVPVTGGLPEVTEAVSLKQDYRCQCRHVIKKGEWHALYLMTGTRVCRDCALDQGVSISLFWHWLQGRHNDQHSI